MRQYEEIFTGRSIHIGDSVQESDRFVLGLDIILGNDEDKLLEYNMVPATLNDHYSSVRHVLQTGLDKLLMHEMLGELMPDYREASIGPFTNNVYKKRLGFRGSGVSIMNQPYWIPEIVEEFITPEEVVRIYAEVSTSNGISYKLGDIVVKDSDKPTHDNTRFLKVKNTNRELSIEMQIRAEIIAKEFFEAIYKTGVEREWNPTNIWDRPIIQHYLGISPIDRIDETVLMRIRQTPFVSYTTFTGHPNNISKAINYGTDVILVNETLSVPGAIASRVNEILEDSIFQGLDFTAPWNKYRFFHENEQVQLKSMSGKIQQSFPDKVVTVKNFDWTMLSDKLKRNYAKRLNAATISK